MKELDCLIIADDLTGACDAAVPFARRGLATSVMLAADAPPAAASVIAVSTESRHLDESAASAEVAQLADWLTAHVIFKKIDSLLRGHPGAEIAAALQAFECDAAIATRHFPPWAAGSTPPTPRKWPDLSGRMRTCRRTQ